jgi:hypothetical protein
MNPYTSPDRSVTGGGLDVPAGGGGVDAVVTVLVTVRVVTAGDPVTDVVRADDVGPVRLDPTLVVAVGLISAVPADPAPHPAANGTSSMTVTHRRDRMPRR